MAGKRPTARKKPRGDNAYQIRPGPLSPNKLPRRKSKPRR